ncbi:methyl-accepting chemotaxis protein [Janthinobacterium fluminis]|uniref:Methyl-accepting chemotaxis protein n=1 Tax=Janthinobacterium fluminis TaxID=2987524 RepID=A0ABT5K617_9BURK|nr:methyl-accepting chemotaxis protein [Janthinobacterium fluminis]MDC8760369.1 methyl-accepting chemotaxis protein [Janthinobacterium fluminis]
MKINLKIGTRLALAFGALLLMMVMIAYIGWSALAATKAGIDTITDENNVKIALANKMEGNLNRMARAVRNYILYTDKDSRRTMLARLAEARKGSDEASDTLGGLVRTDKAKQLFAEIKARREESTPLFGNVVALVDAGKTEEATQFLQQSLQGPQDKWFAALRDMVELQERQNKLAVEEMERGHEFAVRFLIGAVLAALAVGCVLVVVITRGVLKQLGGEPDYAADIAGQIAGGDLAVAIDLKAHDQSSLLFAMRGMRDNLARLVGEVRISTDTIATASSQIAAGNLDLSSRTEQQASSLEETASSMEELTSTVKQNADNARQANQLAASASDVATRGGTVVSQVVDTMSSINDSSKKIVDIIGVIDGIAFQTNILALNAAVEAARAGEQGRGFAVVASEVRNLAQRSAAAAKEIKGLIGDSVEKVEVGTKLVDQAGSTMLEVVESVRRVTDVMSEIMAAGQEQSAGIEQINQAVIQMDQVTQQNAALVEQAAAAAESMQDQAANLAQLVSVFKTGAHQAVSVAPARKRAVPSRVALAAKQPAGRAAARPALKAVPGKRAAAGADEWDEF